MNIAKQLMMTTIMIVGLLATSLSWTMSDTSLSVGGVTQVSAAEKTEPLDLNTTTADQLKALPGTGDAYSEKITP